MRYMPLRYATFTGFYYLRLWENTFITHFAQHKLSFTLHCKQDISYHKIIQLAKPPVHICNAVSSERYLKKKYLSIWNKFIRQHIRSSQLQVSFTACLLTCVATSVACNWLLFVIIWAQDGEGDWGMQLSPHPYLGRTFAISWSKSALAEHKIAISGQKICYFGQNRPSFGEKCIKISGKECFSTPLRSVPIRLCPWLKFFNGKFGLYSFSGFINESAETWQDWIESIGLLRHTMK